MPSDIPSPIDPLIPLSVPRFAGREWEYVKECLDTGWVSSVGSFVERFERETAAYVGCRHAVAAVNGTSALHIALLLAGVQPDDEVLVSSLTFIAPANAIRYAGAHPIFVDAEPDYWQMDVARAAAFLQEQCRVEGGCLRNRKTGRRISAIVPVHILGHPVDMAPLLELARRYGLRVIEDCAESLGARYRGERVGAMGDFGCLSFNGNKTITTGGGGMLLTNDPEMARRAKYLTTQAKDDPEEYIHHEVGYNYRLVNLLAALGCAQLEQLDGFIARKREIARRYQAAFAPLPGMYLQPEAPWAESIYWLFSVGLKPEIFGLEARQLRDRLKAARIQARPLWQPLHRSPALAQTAEVGMNCPVAEQLYREVLSLPSSPGLTPAEQARVIRSVSNRGGLDP